MKIFHHKQTHCSKVIYYDLNHLNISWLDLSLSWVISCSWNIGLSSLWVMLRDKWLKINVPTFIFMRFMIPIEKCQTVRGKKRIFVLVAEPWKKQNMFYCVLSLWNKYHKNISIPISSNSIDPFTGDRKQNSFGRDADLVDELAS